MPTSARSRCPRFESAEKKLVFELIAKYKHIIENKKTDAVTNEEKNKTWTQIAAEFNAICPSMHYRNVESISKLWKNSKKLARQQAAQERQERIKTGGSLADIIKADENYESIISILNEKTVCGFSNPFDSDKRNIALETDDKNPGESTDKIENEGVSVTYYDEGEVIELIIEDSDIVENINKENVEAGSGVSNISNTPTTRKRVNVNEGEENTTWKRYKPSNLQMPLNQNLQNAKSSTIKKGFDASRRRPTTQVKALTSSFVAQKYESLLEKRISIIDYQQQLLKNQIKQQEEEHALKVELLKLEIVLKKRQI